MRFTMKEVEQRIKQSLRVYFAHLELNNLTGVEQIWDLGYSMGSPPINSTSIG